MSSEATLPSTSDPTGKWDTYDEILEQNNKEIEALEDEHYKKNRLLRLLSRSAFRDQTSSLSIEISDAFMDTLTTDDPGLAARKAEMDALRDAYHK